MTARQPLPRLWLMTDERMGDRLWTALERLPRGSGVVFRHYGLPRRERRALFERVRRVAWRRGLLLLLAGTPRDAIGWRADGTHGRAAGALPPNKLRTASAHVVPELRAAERAGAALVFLSPVHTTRSHPDAKVLGRVRFGLLYRQAKVPVAALGGMTPARGRALRPMGVHGWAAIDAWSG